MSHWVEVATREALPAAGLIGYEVGGHALLLVSIGGIISCFKDQCGHQPVKLSEFGQIQEGQIQCHAHGARFDCQNGSICRGPAFEPLKSYAVKEEQGKIYVDLQEA